MPFCRVIRLICSTTSYLNFSSHRRFSVYRLLYRSAKLVEENQKPELWTRNIFSEKFSKELTSRLKRNGYVYILDFKGAESIAYHLTKDWNGYIFEANPGPGVLTKAILKMSSSCQLRVFEKNEEFWIPLENMSSEHSNLELVKEDFMFLPAFEARSDCEESENLFKNISLCSWSNGISFRFFCIISSKKSVRFFRYLLAVLPERTSIFRYGRCEFFLLLTEKEYRYIKAGPKENFATYRWSTVLYNLFFDISCLEEIPSESFFPVPASQKKNKIQNTFFYFVKLVPKPDLFASANDSNKLPDLYYFVRHHLVKRTALVIPTLESWIPFCGPRLIKEGMNVFTKFGDLSPKQILMLFNQFSSWPEYEDSTFHAALQRFRNNSHFNDEDKEADK